MKKVLLLFISFFLFFQVQAQIQVTFQVDMNSPENPNLWGSESINIWGNFPNLNGPPPIFSPFPGPPDPVISILTYPMVRIPGTSVFTCTISFPDSSIGSTLRFKYINGFSGFKYEGSPQATGELNICGFENQGQYHRELIIPNHNIKVSYCWNMCNQCNGFPAISTNQNLVYGSAFLDVNNNLLRDESEHGFPFIPITLSENGDPLFEIQSGINGFYYQEINSGEKNLSIELPNYLTSTSANQTFTFQEDTGGTHEVNFPINLASDYYDVEIIPSFNNMSAGFSGNASFKIRNNGNNLENIHFKIQLPSNITFISSSPAAILDGNILSWEISQIDALENVDIYLIYSVAAPPVFLPGDFVNWSGSITPVDGEVNTINNYFDYNLPILASFDPNDKTMLLGPEINIEKANNGAPFSYRIRFQNTGNTYATFVHVIDTLESGFDASTFRMVSASHDYSLKITEERYLDWYFPNIMLPDSGTNEIGSHGFILFNVDPILPVFDGEMLRNTAYIHFDFNPEIATNTEVTTIINPLGIKTSSNDQINAVVLSEANQIKLNGDIGKLRHVQLYSVSGQILETWSNDFNLLQLPNLSSGIYFLNCEGEGIKTALKFAIVR